MECYCYHAAPSKCGTAKNPCNCICHYPGLPDDVVKFLILNPKELEKLQKRIRAIKSNKIWKREIKAKNLIK